LLQGIDCPTCGARLLDPPPDAPGLLAQALRQEDLFSQRLLLMTSEYARQTRWSHGPNPAPPDTRQGAPFAVQVVWLPCLTCDLQVHAVLSRLLLEGATCPQCGNRLSEPEARHATEPVVAQVFEAEERFRTELEE
jgi:DNA-directed RNA polymerase subunit RPC12/RpoP